ncbi:MAG: hypothetical protein OHK0039_15730 [Bacteroidia bacterium]
MIFVCNLQDYQPAGGHAVYYFNLPGAASPRFIFDAAGGLLEIYEDSTARITGRVVNDADSTQQWDVLMWLTHPRTYAQWTALGRDIKVELAPPSVVNAFKHDWIIWELDSTRSLLTGVSGTYYGGDTLFLKHDPPNYQFGFQYGVGANAKNGNFGLSGWFRYTGAYTGHGDINVNAACQSYFCDLAVTNVMTECISDSTYEVVLSFAGTGVDFEVSDGITTLTGLTAGTYTFGPYPSNNPVTLHIFDPLVPGCDTTLGPLVADCSLYCELNIDSVSTSCVGADSFAVALTFSGTGGPFNLADNQGNAPLLGVPAGTYTFGPYPNGAWVVFNILDPNNVSCAACTAPVTADCDTATTPICVLDLLTATTACTTDSTFEVSVSFTGGNAAYNLTDNLGLHALAGVVPGTYVLGPYANNTQVQVLIRDVADTTCKVLSPVLTRDCDTIVVPPVCVLSLTQVQAACVTDSTFSVTLGFAGNGSTYGITDSLGLTSLSGLVPGVYVLGPFANNLSLKFTVKDEGNPACMVASPFVTLDCDTPVVVPCVIQVDSSHVACLTNTTFGVSVSFSGNGASFILKDNQGTVFSNIPAGTYVLGPYLNNTPVFVTVYDAADTTCNSTSPLLTADCTPPPVCDVSIDSLDTRCAQGPNFEVLVAVGGTGGYQVGDNQGSPVQTGSSGLYTFGPYANGTLVFITVLDTTLGACQVVSPVITDSCLCNISIDTLFSLCVSDTSFAAVVHLSGNSNNYQITDDQGSAPLTGLGAGIYNYSDYFNSTEVIVTVTDPFFNNCSASAGPITADCTPVPICNISVNSLTAQCLTDSTFELVFSFNGTGTNYSVSDALGLYTLTGLTAGTYTFGSYPNGTQMGVFLADPGIFGCFLGAGPVTADCDTSSANATCATAIPLQCGNNSGTTLGALSTDKPATCGTIAGRGVWFSIMGNDETVMLSTCGGLNAEPLSISVFKGGCDDGLRCVVSADQNQRCADGGVEATFVASAGTPYRIYVSQADGPGQDFSLRMSCTPLKRAGRLYPNPAWDMVDVDVYTPHSEYVRWQLVDMYGRELRSGGQRVAGGFNIVSIPLGQQAAGTYFVRLLYQNGLVDTQSLLIQPR